MKEYNSDNSNHKICLTCQAAFVLSQQDLSFYTKVSLPLPVDCPDCRQIKRLLWRNDRVFFKRQSSFTKQPIISIYPENTPFPVYEPDHWWSDSWDALDYAQELNFNQPFFTQWQNLFNKVPKLSLDLVNCENSYYCNYCGDNKNCYLDIAGEGNEDCYFNLFTKYSKNCLDCTFVYNSELCYYSINCYNCYNLRFCYYLENCNDCDFCFDLKGCQNCLFSSNLRNKQYYVANQAVSKEKYFEALNALQLHTNQGLTLAKIRWLALIRNAIHRDMQLLNTENCSGDNLKNCKSCEFCFNCTDCEDSRYLYDVLEAKDCQDLNYSLYHPEQSCELISTLALKYSAYCAASHYSHNIFYCFQVNHSHDLFGCIGVKNKEYCILNRQYTEAEYKKIKAELISHMQKTGEWGRFFPAQISPWAYNQTVAQEYFPISKEEARSKGYKWVEELAAKPKEAKSFPAEDLLKSSDQEILGKVYNCQESKKPYRIIPQELAHYRKIEIALPRSSPNSRHLARLRMRNSRKMYTRSCSKCSQPISSTYAPTCSEKVWCAGCYLGEIW